MKKIGILGYGLEGMAAHQYFAKHGGADIYIIDDQNVSSIVDDCPKDHILVGEQGRSLALSMQFDLIVRSPGISIYSDFFKQLIAKGAQVTTGTNIWFEENSNSSTVVVTGTKGKSTTSSILAYLLEKSGYKVNLVGNIGTPLVGAPAGKDVTVIELSSYQTADLKHAPNFVLLTNLYPEHLQWHRSVDAYFRDKVRICQMDEDTVVLINSEDKASKSFIGDRRNTFKFAMDDACRISDDGSSLSVENIMIRNFPLKGDHNKLNLIGAISVFKKIIPIDEPIILDFEGFKVLPHRMSEHSVSGDVLCIDDSISTIPESVLAALSVYQGSNLHLFIGGYDRGISYVELLDELSRVNVKAIYLFGPLGARLYGGIKNNKKVICHFDDKLGSAINTASTNISPGDILLLSPGAPSFDEFINFQERGDFFVAECANRLVRNL